VERLPRSRQYQQSPPESVQRGSPSSGDTIKTPAPTCPPTRRSARAKSTLMYDQHYHPMDDVIRPLQAAKRRSLHGERPLLRSSSDDETPYGSDFGVESIVEDEDTDDEEAEPTRSRKRKWNRPLIPEPTRRSSRRRTKPKVSYNMNIHPQDSDLNRVWACDGSKSSPSPTKPTSSTKAVSFSKKTSSGEFEEVCRTLLQDESEGMRSLQAYQRVPTNKADYFQTQHQNRHQSLSWSPRLIIRPLWHLS
jgi:hypothetical protein